MVLFAYPPNEIGILSFLFGFLQVDNRNSSAAKRARTDGALCFSSFFFCRFLSRMSMDSLTYLLIYLKLPCAILRNLTY